MKMKLPQWTAGFQQTTRRKPLWTISLVIALSCVLLASNGSSVALPAESAPSQTSGPPQNVQVKGNVFVYNDLPRMTLTLDAKFQYVGSFGFDVKGVAGGYRYIWGEFDHNKHLRRTFIVQAEGYHPNKSGSYPNDAPNPIVLAGDTYQHAVWIYDNDLNAQRNPGNESEQTKKFMADHGIEWESQLVMSRFARAVNESRRNEIIFFYFENLKDYSSKSVADFPNKSGGADAKPIIDSVDAKSRSAFVIAH